MWARTRRVLSALGLALAVIFCADAASWAADEPEPEPTSEASPNEPEQQPENEPEQPSDEQPEQPSGDDSDEQLLAQIKALTEAIEQKQEQQEQQAATLAAGECTGEAPCVVSLSAEESSLWADWRSAVVIALGVVTLVALCGLLLSWARGRGDA